MTPALLEHRPSLLLGAQVRESHPQASGTTFLAQPNQHLTLPWVTMTVLTDQFPPTSPCLQGRETKVSSSSCPPRPPPSLLHCPAVPTVTSSENLLPACCSARELSPDCNSWAEVRAELAPWEYSTKEIHFVLSRSERNIMLLKQLDPVEVTRSH